jgi:hypothetical protein
MNQENSACALIGQLSFVFSFEIISSKRFFGKTGGYLESSVYGPLKAPAHTNLSNNARQYYSVERMRGTRSVI